MEWSCGFVGLCHLVGEEIEDGEEDGARYSGASVLSAASLGTVVEYCVVQIRPVRSRNTGSVPEKSLKNRI